MSQYVSLQELGPGTNNQSVPSMAVPIVPKTFSAGYNSLTHNVPTPDSYYEYPNAYMIPEIKTCGYTFMKRKCDGNKLYPLDSNL